MSGFVNGKAQSHTGFRQVAFDTNLTPRPVIYTIESGLTPSRGTVQQEPEVSDIVIRLDWTRRNHLFTVEKVGNSPLPLEVQQEYKEKLFQRYAWLEEFLVPAGRESSFLPAQVYGGESLAAKAKRERCEFAFQRYGLPLEYKSDWVRSPKQGINTKAATLPFDPDTYQAHYKTWDGSIVGINRKEQFWGSAGDFTPAVELKPILNEIHGSNYAHEKTEYREGVPGIPDWRNYRYLIRLIEGAYTREHFSYGIMLDIWHTN